MLYRINFSAQERRRYRWRQRGWLAVSLLPLLAIIGVAGWMYRGETEHEIISEIAKWSEQIETAHQQFDRILEPLQHMAPLVSIPRDHAATIQHIILGTTQSRQHQLIPRRFEIEPDGSWKLDMFHVMPAGLSSYAEEAELARIRIREKLPDIGYTANWPAKEIGGRSMQLHITLTGNMNVPPKPDFQLPSMLAQAWKAVEEHRTAMREIVRPSTQQRFGFIKRLIPGSDAKAKGATTFLERIRQIIIDLIVHPDESVQTKIRSFNAVIDNGTDDPGKLIKEITTFLAEKGLGTSPQYEALQALGKEWERYANRKFCLQQAQLDALCKRRDTLRALREHIPSPEQVTNMMQGYHALQALPPGWFSYNDHLKEQRPNELLQFLLDQHQLRNHLRFTFPKEVTGRHRLLPVENPLFRTIEWNVALKSEKEDRSVSVAYVDLVRLLEALEQAQGLFLPRSVVLSFRRDNPGILDYIQIRGILPLFDMTAVEKAFQSTAAMHESGGSNGP